MNRRDFTSAMSLALAAAAAPQTPQVRQPVSLGLDAFSLRSQNWTPFQVLDFCAHWNLKYVQFGEPRFIGDLSPANLERIRERAEELGIALQVGLLSICPTSRLFDHKSGTAEEQIARMVPVARTLRSPFIRAVLGNENDRSGPIEAHIENMVQVLRAVRPLMQDNNLKFAIENHSGDMQARELKMLIEEAGADLVGVCLDSGNPMITIEDPHLTLETLAPYVLTSHNRDTAVWHVAEGVSVAWVCMGDGNIGIDGYVKRYLEVCSGKPLLLEIIVSRPRVFKYHNPAFWDRYRNTPAWEFARFVTLADNGTVLPLAPPPAKEMVAERERADVEKSIRYTGHMLDRL